MAGLWALGTVVAGYAKFVKRYNILWFVAPYVPLWAYLFYNWGRQPTQEIENSYNFVLAKRSATAALEANRSRFASASFAGSSEVAQIQ